MLRAAPWLALALFLGPVVCGLAGTVYTTLGLPRGAASDAWLGLLAVPALGWSVALSLGSGLAATLLALAGAVTIAATTRGGSLTRPERFLLPFLLAVPHLTSAVGTAFLVAPSGWLARCHFPRNALVAASADLPIPTGG